MLVRNSIALTHAKDFNNAIAMTQNQSNASNNNIIAVQERKKIKRKTKQKVIKFKW